MMNAFGCTQYRVSLHARIIFCEDAYPLIDPEIECIYAAFAQKISCDRL